MANKSETGILTLYSDVQATSVRWLWYPFIAVGKITLLQGDPSDGKSTMMMNLIAELSKGGSTPDGKPVGMPRKIIYQCSEDGVSDTIKPRLEKCGADCRNVAFINEDTYSGLTLDDERIRQAIIEFRPRLVVIDPIQAYLGSDSDLQIAGRARKLMHRLGIWASVYDCAIVLIGHLNKKEGTKGLYRSLGSIDVVAAARSVLQVERDPENTDIRIVRQIKNSLAPSDGEIRFSSAADAGSHRVTKMNESNSCEIKCMAFSRMVYQDARWSFQRSYRLMGKSFETQKLVSFDIREAIPIENGKIVDEAGSPTKPPCGENNSAAESSSALPIKRDSEAV